jgi:hypothetical protein
MQSHRAIVFHLTSVMQMPAGVAHLLAHGFCDHVSVTHQHTFDAASVEGVDCRRIVDGYATAKSFATTRRFGHIRWQDHLSLVHGRERVARFRPGPDIEVRKRLEISYS